MNLLRIAFTVAATILPTAAVPTLDAVVSSNYPADLHDFTVNHRLEEHREQAYATISADSEYIVAAYSNGHTGAVVLLQKSGATYLAKQEISHPISGSSPVVTAKDLDHDGISEAIIRFDAGKGASVTWICRVSTGQLTVISPRNKFGGSELLFPDIVDFSGDGRMDIIEDHIFGSRSDPTIRHDRYVLQNGTYAAAAPLDFYRIFYRSKGSPGTETVTFAIPKSDLSKPYRLTVLNGGSSGKELRVASGTITLNGIVVSPSSDFSESRATWSVPVVLQEQNTLSVKVAGQPAGRVGIAIRHD
jgi:hypothetical protein